MSTNKKKEDDNPLYVDEVSEVYLKEKKEYQIKKRTLVIIILVIFLALLLISLGLFFGNFNKKESGDLKKYSVYDLFVVHSKTSFGDTIKSFSPYTSYEKAYSYTFYIDNANNAVIDYKVILVDFSKTKIDKSKINYAILKNKEVILDDKNEDTLVLSKIASLDRDNYELRLWSKENISDFEFKIKVGD